MGCYLYCIGPERLPAPDGDLRGLDGTPVLSWRLSPFTVWVSPAERAPTASIERIRRHDRVVRAATTATSTPLPVRFGQWFPAREALADRLHEKADGYREALRVVHRAVEFGLRVVDPGARPLPVPKADGDGRAYMEALARRHARRDEARERGRRVAEELRAHFGPVVRSQRADPGDGGGLLVEVSHLVRRDEIGRYRREAERYRKLHRELSLLLSGPWPPYSFAA